MNGPRGHRSRPQQQAGSSPPSGSSTVQPIAYYKDAERKVLNPDLVDRAAEQVADNFCQRLTRPYDKLTPSQVRRFFGEVKNIYNCLQEGRSWSDLELRFRMIKSRASYASGTRRIPKEFATFLAYHIDQVKDAKDFEAFVQHFEAVLGFMYGKGLVTK